MVQDFVHPQYGNTTHTISLKSQRLKISYPIFATVSMAAEDFVFVAAPKPKIRNKQEPKRQTRNKQLDPITLV